MDVKRRNRGAYSDNDYFRMGAMIAVGELYDMAAFRGISLLSLSNVLITWLWCLSAK